MAGTSKVMLVRRPMMPAVDANGVSTDPAVANYLEVTLDQFGKGTDIQVFRFAFADHAGLQAEWEAGVATTVLNGVLTAAIGSLEWPPSALTAAQRAYIATIV